MNIGLIPARLNSRRLPKKILANLCGKPLIAHTMERALMAEKLDKVILAIDSEETKEALKKFNFDIVMTSDQHHSGTDRIAEVVREIKDADVIINIQGDEPLISPQVIDDLVDLFNSDDSVDIATVVSRDLTVADLLNPNVVKTFIDEKKNAIDFKRCVLDLEIGGAFRHIGMYGYRKEALLKFTMLEQSKREIEESLEQLRILDNDIDIKVLIASCNNSSVDTFDDLVEVEKIIREMAE